MPRPQCGLAMTCFYVEDVMGKVMERRYICEKTGIVERTRFVVGENTQIRSGWKKAKTSADKREENARSAIRDLARLLNCNAGPEDWFVMLDFSPKAWDRFFSGLDEDSVLREAQRQGSLFLRRLKRKAQGAVKSVLTASDRDPETGEPVRVHLHLWLSGVTEEEIYSCWSHGECAHAENLWKHQDDYTPLAVYMLSQVRSIENMKKYIPSRNLDKPKIEERVVVGDPGEEIKVQPGAKVLDRMTYRDGSVVQYVRYKRRPAVKKRGGHKLQDTGQAEGGAGHEFS